MASLNPILKHEDRTERKSHFFFLVRVTEASAQGANLNSQTSAQVHFKF